MWPHPKPVTPGHSCVTTRKAAKMTDHNDPEFGFDKTAALSDPGCDGTNPACTFNGHNPPSKAPSSHVETTEPVSGTTSYTGVIRGADEAEAT